MSATTRTRYVRTRPYPLPRGGASEDDDLRLYGLDVGTMTPGQRWAENQAARAALAAVIRGNDPVIVYGVGEALRASDWLSLRVEQTQNGRP